MMLPLVPLPLELSLTDSPALRITANLRITGDADAAAALTALIMTRTGAEVIDAVGDEDILGVEAPLWTETVRTPEDIDRMAFPRIAAVAEAAWSPRDGDLRDWESFRVRVGGLAPLWTSLGIAYHPSAQIPRRSV